MTNKDLTHIAVVMDRSGSMATIKADVEGGFNAFVAEQRNGPGQAKLSLTEFNTLVSQTYLARNINEVPNYNLYPAGGTALLDAVGKTIIETGAYLRAIPEEHRPGNVVFVIITDGEENSSREFTRDKIKQMITHQQEAYSWKFLYLGANVDAFAEAGGLGIPVAAAMPYAHTSGGTSQAFAGASSSLLRGRTLASAGASSAAVLDSYNFTDEERDKAADGEELSKP